MFSKLAKRMDLVVFIFFQIIVLRSLEAMFNAPSLLAKKCYFSRPSTRLAASLSLSLLLLFVL